MYQTLTICEQLECKFILNLLQRPTGEATMYRLKHWVSNIKLIQSVLEIKS